MAVIAVISIISIIIITIVFIIIVVVILSSTQKRYHQQPISHHHRIGCLHYLHINLTVKGYIPSESYLRHRGMVDVLNGVVYGLVLPCVFVATTTITTVITTYNLRSAAAWRQQSSGGSASRKVQEKHEVGLGCECCEPVCKYDHAISYTGSCSQYQSSYSFLPSMHPSI